MLRNKCDHEFFPSKLVFPPQQSYGVCMAPARLYVVGNGSRGYSPVFANLNPQSTCHGPKPGPTLAPQCSHGSRACPASKNTRRTRGQKSKKCRCARNVYLVHSNIYTRLLRLTPPAKYRGAQHLGSGCRWALE